jgi:hypothetical protein
MSDTPRPSLTLLSVLRQWPIASNVAEHLPAGSLIHLARSSISLRAILHGFDMTNALEGPFTSGLGASARSEDAEQDIWPRKMLHIGAHRTQYWEGLKRATPFICSSKTHTKGDKTRSCLYCSMPICESCVVKHSFGKNENTFKNRCRFMCQLCWDTGNIQREQRYSGRLGVAEDCSHKSASEAREFCTCTSKNGWVCNDCKETQNASAKVIGAKVCFGLNCNRILEEDKDRRKFCLWCDKPVPRSRASMESRIAFDQRMSDARARELNSQMADFEEYRSNRRREMRMSRREMRGDEAVKDDPDADLQQFLRNLDIINYQNYCYEQPTGDEIYASKHGSWKYNTGFLKRFMKRCSSHKQAEFIKRLTCSDSPDSQSLKTNMDLWVMKDRRMLDEQAEIDELTEGLEAVSDADSNSEMEGIESLDIPKDQVSNVKMGPFKGPAEMDEQREFDNDISMLQEDETTEAQKEAEAREREEREEKKSTKATKIEVDPAESISGSEPPNVQPGERPPDYGADTLILESGDAIESD